MQTLKNTLTTVLLGLSASSLNAAVVFSESFSMAGAINGSAVESGSGTWQSNMTVSGGTLQIADNGYLNIDLAAQPATRIELSFDLINANQGGGDGIVMVSLGATGRRVRTGARSAVTAITMNSSSGPNRSLLNTAAMAGATTGALVVTTPPPRARRTSL